MADSYYTPDGGLAVWTGTGYHIIPPVAASDIGTLQGEWTTFEMGDNPAPRPEFQEYQGILDPGKYGLPNDPNNFMRLYNNNSGELDYLLKSADKEGTQIRYVLKDGQYVPQLMGTQGWDTNDDSSGAVALNVGKVLAAPFAVAGLQGAGLLGQGAGAAGAVSPGTMTTYGLLDTSMALPGTQFVSGVAAGAAPNMTTYGILDKSAALPGTQFVNGAAGPGTMTTYGILDKSVALPGTQFVDGIPAGSSLWKGAADALMKPSNLATLGKLGGVLAGGALGTQGQNGGGGQTAIAQPVPTMYGGAAPNAPSWGPMGNTETERRMRKDYYPGLLGGQNPWGY